MKKPTSHDISSSSGSTLDSDYLRVYTLEGQALRGLGPCPGSPGTAELSVHGSRRASGFPKPVPLMPAGVSSGPLTANSGARGSSPCPHSVELWAQTLPFHGAEGPAPTPPHPRHSVKLSAQVHSHSMELSSVPGAPHVENLRETMQPWQCKALAPLASPQG